ncbi:MAG: ABC-2 family transporter protein [Litorilinea sp.]
MRIFWIITWHSIRRHLTYRAAAWAGLITNIFFGILRAAVLLALLGARAELAGVTAQDAITFTALTQAIIAYLSIFGWYELMNSVHTGQVSGDLLKPLGLFRYWLAVDLGRAGVALLLRGCTIMLIYAAFVPITTPPTPAHWLALAVSLSLAWYISFAWRFIVNLAAFWSPNAAGVGRFAFGITWVLSGFFLPLRFYPDWFIALCNATPFPAMVNTVIEIYLGLVHGQAMLYLLAQQVVWAIALYIAAQLILRAGIRRLVIQGG